MESSIHHDRRLPGTIQAGILRPKGNPHEACDEEEGKEFEFVSSSTMGEGL